MQSDLIYIFIYFVCLTCPCSHAFGLKGSPAAELRFIIGHRPIPEVKTIVLFFLCWFPCDVTNSICTPSDGQGYKCLTHVNVGLAYLSYSSLLNLSLLH